MCVCARMFFMDIECLETFSLSFLLINNKCFLGFLCLVFNYLLTKDMDNDRQFQSLV